MMNTKAILELEDLLLQIKESSSAKGSGLVKKFLEKLCEYLGSSSVRSPQKILFDQSNSQQQRKFIAVFLLRLLCVDENAVWESIDFRNHVFLLFDEQISESYNTLGIKINDDNNEKLVRLRDAENKLFHNFEDITNSIVSLQTAIDIRNRYMQNLNHSLHKLFLDQFIDASLISRERLKEIFSVLVQYQKSSTLSRLDSYKNLQSLFNLYFYDTKKLKSIIASICIFNPLQKIKDVVDQDFRENDAIKPTSVSLISSNRKYPFHILEKKFLIKITLQIHGPGHAFDTHIDISAADYSIEILNPSIYLGSLKPGKIEVTFEAVVRKESNSKPALLGYFSWSNYNGPTNTKEFILELTPQRADIDWEKLRTSKPYTLEAVETEKELVGRNELLETLFTKLTLSQLESAIIYGQKRVGKTSIAKTLQSKVRKELNYTTVFINVGDLDKLSSSKFVTSIGEEMVYEIKYDPALLRLGLEIPKFDGALAPLSRYFKEIKRIKPDHKFLLILDEFDEIPYELINYTPIGDTFFHNIRSLSSENQIGFVLVGSENMQIILQSTDRLNKFDTYRVDYFDKEYYWNDFQELIRRPVKDSIEFDDEAIVALYEMTEGNPFYTKLICMKIFEKACDLRNSFISRDEVDLAVRNSNDLLDLNHVNHFWKDGIFQDVQSRRDQIETQRRRFLIAFAEIVRAKERVKIDDLLSSPILQSDVALKEILESFVSRGIIVESSGNYRLKPKFFEKWLIEKGYQIMTKLFLDEDAVIALKAKEEEVYVRDTEIIDLSESWGLYRGSRITDAQVRSWLSQFSDNIERRLMFKLLQNLRFYDEPKVREKLRIIHESVLKGLLYDKKYRYDILLSSFGNISKSGPSYTRLYATENKVILDNIAAPKDIPSILTSNRKIEAIVFIDDIIASGQTVIDDYLIPFSKEHSKLFSKRNVKIVMAAICGLDEGIERLENIFNTFPFRIECKVADLFSDKDKCFSEKSVIFSSLFEIEKAKQVAEKYGAQLVEREIALGYKNSQLLVVFHDNCPDNTLPILWKSSNIDPEWRPLFKRN